MGNRWSCRPSSTRLRISTRQPALKELPPAPPPLAHSQRAPSRSCRTARQSAPNLPPKIAPTVIRFSPELETLGSAQVPGLKFTVLRSGIPAGRPVPHRRQWQRRSASLLPPKFLRRRRPRRTGAKISRGFSLLPNRKSRIGSRNITSSGALPSSSGATTSRPLPRLTPAPLRRDSRQPLRAGHDLFAGFSCGGFSPLDSWRVESPPSRASRFALSAAMRDLRVRI